MILRSFLIVVLAGALSNAASHRADADSGDFVTGAIVGGVVGYAIGKENEKAKQKSRTNKNSTQGTTLNATTQGAQTQTALNYFGYNAGTVDGQIGPRSRTAIERYQVAMGYPVNGRDLQPYQFDFLMQAYNWAISGGQTTTQLSGEPLLLAYRQQSQTGATTAAATTGDTNTSATLPSLFAGGSTGPSLANHCNTVMLQTSTQGGQVTLASMSDPNFALSEQFCLARSYAIANGEEKMGEITGMTPKEISAQCDALGAALMPKVEMIPVSTQSQVEADVRSFALGTGLAPADLAATSRVCLALGYSQDKMETAIGSSLLLVAIGEPAYGELIGHHLREGFGLSKRQDLAAQWYNASLGAVDQGAAAVFMPGQPERTQLIRAAMHELEG